MSFFHDRPQSTRIKQHTINDRDAYPYVFATYGFATRELCGFTEGEPEDKLRLELRLMDQAQQDQNPECHPQKSTAINVAKQGPLHH